MATLLNTNIRGEQIVPATISGGHLDTDVSPTDGQVLSYSDSGPTLTWSDIPTLTINEVPTGDINGTNTDFTLANTPISDSEKVYLNGLLQEPGAGNDYTISSDTITFNLPPVTDDVLLVTYLINSAGSNNVPYGYSMGGYVAGTDVSTIDRITFPFDSGTASQVGNLSGVRGGSAGCNSSNYGYNMGGYDGSYLTTIDRITFPFDSGTASHVGNLSGAQNGLAGCNSSNYGFSICGSKTGSSLASTIDRIEFPFDSGTASHVGNAGVRHHVAGFNSSNYGYSCGGWNGGANTATIYRITFPFDSGNASYVGNLSGARTNIGGCNSSNYGFTVGGLYWNSVHHSTIDRILFPFDSGTATHVGNLTVNKDIAPSCNSTNYGYTLGGGSYYLGTYYSSVDRITFPFDSGTAIQVGNLSDSVNYGCAIDGTDFVSLFV